MLSMALDITCPCLFVDVQVVLPASYLQHAYAHVRAAGGVCIADEVQARTTSAHVMHCH